MTRDDIFESGRKHAALTQFHRWYQFYENAAVPIENQLDILAPGIRLSSGLGEGVGHDVYRERVAQLPSHWRNAHFVEATEVTIAPDGSIALSTPA